VTVPRKTRCNRRVAPGRLSPAAPFGRGPSDLVAGVWDRRARSRARTCAPRRARRPRSASSRHRRPRRPPAIRRTSGAPPAAPPPTAGSHSTTGTLRRRQRRFIARRQQGVPGAGQKSGGDRAHQARGRCVPRGAQLRGTWRCREFVPSLLGEAIGRPDQAASGASIQCRPRGNWCRARPGRWGGGARAELCVRLLVGPPPGFWALEVFSAHG